MITTEDYRDFLTEYIRKQIVMLGADVALSVVKRVPGMEIDAKGEVVSVSGDAQVILNETLAAFKSLYGNVGAASLETLFEKFPAMKEQHGSNG